MSVGDSETPQGRPPVTEAKSRGPGSIVESRSVRVPAASPPPDGPIATAMEVLDLGDGAGQQNRQSWPVATFQSPRICSSGGENKEREDWEATRCELERLLTTAGTNDKKQKIKEALDHLEDQSSGRGTALAIIVNDTLAVASAAAASSKKRRQSFAGHEHGVARGRVADALAPTRRSRFDRDRFELWRPNDRNGGAVSRTPASEAAGVGQADSTSAAARSSGGETLEPEPQLPVVSARRFTAQVLPSIPEHRVLGRRVLVRETSGGGGRGGGEASSRNERSQNSKIDDCGVQRNERKEEEQEASSKLIAEGGHASNKPESSLASPRRKREVLDVPHGLFGEASSSGVDPSHPPCAAVDGVLASFWLSTGLFPQTLTIRLQRPVAVYEVMVACGGVNAARVHLGHVNSSVRYSSREGGGGAGVGDGYYRDARAARGGRWKEGSLLELVGEQQRPSATGGGASSAALSNNSYSSSGPSRKMDPSLALARMTFRVPGEGGRLAEKVDRLSLVVTSARAPFCLVTSVTIRGQFGGDAGEEE